MLAPLKKFRLLWLCCLCFLLPVKSQTKLDTLILKAEQAADKEKPKLFADIAWMFYAKDFNKYFYYSDKGLKAAVKVKDLYYTAYTLRQVGIYYDVNGEPKKAIQLIDSALNINKRIKDEGGISACFSSLGIINYNTGEYDKALYYYQECLKIYEKNNDLPNISQMSGNIGGIYRALREHDKAKVYYLKAVEFAEKAGRKKPFAIALNNLGSQYIEEENYAEAEKVLLKSLKLKEEIGEPQSLVYTLQSLSNLYLKQSDFKKATEIGIKSLELSKKTGDKKLESMSYKDLGYLYLKLNDTTKALSNYTDGYSIALSSGNLLNVSESSKKLSEIYKGKGDFQKALFYHTVYTNANDSIYKVEKFKSFNEMQTKYETEKKEQEILLLSKEKLLKDAELQRANAERQHKIQELALSEQEKKLSQVQLEKTKALNEASEKENKLLKLDQQVKDAELAKQHLENQKAQELSKRRTQQLYGALIGALLVLLLLGVILRGYSQKKKANQQLLEKNDLINQQKKEVEHQKELVEEKNKEITDSINYAKRLQEAILPPVSLIKQALPDSFVFYKPKDIVAGDFYWMYKTIEGDKEVVFIAAADCTGHGVPGAMVSMVCSNALNRAVKEFNLSRPDLILNKVRDLVIETFEASDQEVKDGMDISLLKIEKAATGTGEVNLQWAGANNPLLCILSFEDKTKVVKEIKADKQPIGKYTDAKPFTNNDLTVPKGSCLYLYTDGYPDQFGGPKGKKFKYKQLEELLLKIHTLGFEEQEKHLNSSITSWRGNLEQVDDICVIGLKV